MDEIFALQRAEMQDVGNGTLHMTAAAPLAEHAARVGDWIEDWAAKAPGTLFIAERSGAGWASVTYCETLERIRALASSLMGLGLGADDPLLLLSGKGVDHALLVLAAQYVGIPTVAVAEQYSLIAGAEAKLRHVVDTVRPGAVYAADGARFATAFASTDLAGIPKISSTAVGAALSFDTLSAGDHGVDIDAAASEVGPDTLAKLLFTSGSTSLPKAVRTTHRMITSNQAQIAQVWPFLTRRKPRIVDWLPWNHTFGGSHNFYMMLANGGTQYIDDGGATKAGIGRTVENISLVGQTISFNVPIAYAMMADVMQDDGDFRARFFGDLDLVHYAAAAMPPAIWRKIEEHAIAQTGHVPAMSAGWGMTETAPAALMVHGPMPEANNVGIPMPGLTARLVPVSEGIYELRVKGPNVTEGYHREPAKTAEAFDDDGFLLTGDTVRVVDPDDPSAGLTFEGRIAEDFKLLTGTWVQVTKVRTGAVGMLAPLVQDLVICGEGRSEIGALVIPSATLLRRLGENAGPDGDVITEPGILAELRSALSKQSQQGSSTRVARLIVLSEPPSFGAGEITQKGNLNQRQMIKNRAALIGRLYDDADDAVVRLKGTLND